MSPQTSLQPTPLPSDAAPPLVDQDRAHLAAEYVLGLLSRAEAGLAEELLALDPEFARQMARWQACFAGFDAQITPAAPPPDLRDAVLAGAAQPGEGPRDNNAISWVMLMVGALVGSLLLFAIERGGWLASDTGSAAPPAASQTSE